jgi:hypothetical protein
LFYHRSGRGNELGPFPTREAADAAGESSGFFVLALFFFFSPSRSSHLRRHNLFCRLIVFIIAFQFINQPYVRSQLEPPALADIPAAPDGNGEYGGVNSLGTGLFQTMILEENGPAPLNFEEETERLMKAWNSLPTARKEHLGFGELDVPKIAALSSEQRRQIKAAEDAEAQMRQQERERESCCIKCGGKWDRSSLYFERSIRDESKPSYFVHKRCCTLLKKNDCALSTNTCRMAVGGEFFGNEWFYVDADDYREMEARLHAEHEEARAAMSPKERHVDDCQGRLDIVLEKRRQIKKEMTRAGHRKHGWSEYSRLEKKLGTCASQIEAARKRLREAKKDLKNSQKKTKATARKSTARKSKSSKDAVSPGPIKRARVLVDDDEEYLP